MNQGKIIITPDKPFEKRILSLQTILGNMLKDYIINLGYFSDLGINIERDDIKIIWKKDEEMKKNEDILQKYEKLKELIRLTRVYTPNENNGWDTNISLDMVQELWKHVDMPLPPSQDQTNSSHIFKIHTYQAPNIPYDEDD